MSSKYTISHNGILFVTAQFLSRYLNQFLSSACRNTLLEVGGSSRFANAQFVQTISRTLAAQVSGVLTDTLPAQSLFIVCDVLTSVFLIIFGLLLHGIVPHSFSPAVMLTICAVYMGLAFTFAAPVGRSMPPSVVSSDQELTLVNAYELTSDKIARYLSPFVVSIFLPLFGFNAILWLTFVAYIGLAFLKSSIKIMPTKNGREVKREKLSFMGELWSGVLLLFSPELGGLVAKTMLTNMFVYPFQSVAIPIILKRASPANWQAFLAVVNLGGVVGPLLSGFFVIQMKSRMVAIQVSSYVQILGSIALALVSVSELPPMTLGVCISALWIFMTAANNIYTTAFNAEAQAILPRDQRGKFMANILTLFTVGNAMGLGILGWGSQSEDRFGIYAGCMLGVGAMGRVFLLFAGGKRKNELKVE